MIVGFLSCAVVVSCGLLSICLRFLQIIGGAWFNAIGAALRVVSSAGFIDDRHRYYLLIGGQSLASIAQPFFLFVPTKVAALWFKENQRATANTISSMGKFQFGTTVTKPDLGHTKLTHGTDVGVSASPLQGTHRHHICSL